LHNILQANLHPETVGFRRWDQTVGHLD